MRYGIGPFDLDTEARLLRLDGRGVAMQPRVFDVLSYLARNAPRVVPKEELFEKLWPGVFVTEASLQRVASILRGVLREGGAESLLRSVPRVGYALDIPPPPQAMPSPDEQVMLTRAVMARPAVCVLPLNVEAADCDPAIADGLVFELIAGLSAWRLFPVISSFTAFRYRNTAKTLRAIGAELGARYVLTGMLRSGAGGFVVSLELTDTEIEQQLWTRRISIARDELPRLEEEISRDIVAAVVPELETAEWQRAARIPAGDANAWELAMRSRWLIERFEQDDLAVAIDLARQAARLDPGFSLPHSLVAFARFQQAMAGWGAESDTAYRDVFRPTLEAAREALVLDPGSWLAQALAGVGELWANHDHDAATAHLDRAVSLNPTSSMAYHFAGCIAGFCGNTAKAIYNQAQVFRIDPFYPYAAVVEADLGLWHIIEGDSREAARWLDRSTAKNPAYVRGVQRRIVLEGLLGYNSPRLAVEQIPPAALSLEQVEASYPFLKSEHRDLFIGNYQRGLGLLSTEDRSGIIAARTL
jgi:DNA-binding winged helix-turn-helix (wHTH) protein/tetratricopeptide (TPR) repeat protein